MTNCIICQKACRLGASGITCSPACHEELVRRVEEKCGKFKQVVRMTTGEAFKVPTRDIIERGIREQELDKYPKWED